MKALKMYFRCFCFWSDYIRNMDLFLRGEKHVSLRASLFQLLVAFQKQKQVK
jgi:hypothetical protein